MNSPIGPIASHTADDMRRAADPSTPPEVLAQLAYEHESLWPWIVANPSAYQGLRDWVAEQRASDVQVAPTRFISAAPAFSASSSQPYIAPVAAPTVAAPTAARKAGMSTPLLVSLIVGAVLLVGGGVTAVVVVTALNAQQASITSELDALNNAPEQTEEPIVEVPEAAEPAIPTPADTLPAEPVVDSRIPSCDRMYSPGYAGTLAGAGMTLTSGWSVSSPAGTADPVLAELLGGALGVECRWHGAQGGDTGIETKVSGVTPEEAVAATSRFAALGYKTVNELGGTRYFLETKNASGVKIGESHIIRDGLWFATRWIDYGPPGYTADIVTRVLG